MSLKKTTISLLFLSGIVCCLYNFLNFPPKKTGNCKGEKRPRFTRFLDVDNFFQSNAVLEIPKKVGQFGSHLIPLSVAVLATKGPILEMGAGIYSTRMLDSIAKIEKRDVLTAERNENWLTKVLNSTPDTRYHKFQLVKADGDWENVGKDQFWSVVFVDHSPGWRRKEDIAKFACSAELVVVHDTERPGYQYENAMEKYSFKVTYLNKDPNTVILSNYFNLEPIRALF